MLTQQYIKNILHYNSTTGVFSWVNSTKEAGAINGDGYRDIMIDGKSYKAARLAFLYITGRLPDKIDHINNIRTDDRWSNLREVTSTQNSWNRRKASNNTSGIKGLSINIGKKDRWYCKVVKNGIRYDKYFPLSEKEQAIQWLIEIRQQLHGDFTNHG